MELRNKVRHGDTGVKGTSRIISGMEITGITSRMDVIKEKTQLIEGPEFGDKQILSFCMNVLYFC